MTRGAFLGSLGFGGLLAGQKRRPNVLFIAVDDLRPELGVYGAQHVHSPRMDALGRSGVVFSKAYCQMAVCNPSRASLLTGLRPDTLKVWDLKTPFRETTPNAVTLPQRFRESGYHTAEIGKIFHNSFPDRPSWSEPDLHIDGYPFDPDAVYRSASEVAALDLRKRKIAEAGQQAPYMDRYGHWYLKQSATEAPDVADEAYYDGAQARVAVDKLREFASKKQPFFFGVGFYRPHLPYNAPKKYWDLYDRSKIPLAGNAFQPKGAPHMAGNMNRELRGYQDFLQAPKPHEGSLPEADARRLKHGYLASVSYVDAQVGKLLDALDQNGLRDNTIVVLWGDHGYKLGEHNGWGKMTNYEIDARAPLMVRAPGFATGACNRLVEFVDVYPTLCELAGIAGGPELEGQSFVPLLRKRDRKWKPAVFHQFLREGVWVAQDGVEYMGYAIRTERFRYVEWVRWKDKAAAGRELYDLVQDPGENVNRIGLPGSDALAGQLSAKLRAGWKDARA
jgi:iduronate 2-sulfatase